jgi:hypothetical protein
MFIKGVSFGFLAKKGYYCSKEGYREIDRICNSGVNWVALIATVMQDSYYSTRMYADFEYTPSDYELIETIRKFHENGIKVMLKPMIECHDSVWRGSIGFPHGHQQIQGIVTDYWGEWFKNYSVCMTHYGKLAEMTNVEMLCLGCEMLGAEPMEDYWPEIIKEVRSCYNGLITYNADQYFPERPFVRKWFSLLDVLGISFYTGTPRKNPSAEEIAGDLRPAAVQIAQITEETGVPLFFAECGARSVVDGTKTPCAFQNSGSYDGEAQANYLKAVIRTFSEYEWWKGLLWWKWDEQQVRPHYKQPGGDTGFTIYGKPAADVMSRWCENQD